MSLRREISSSWAVSRTLLFDRLAESKESSSEAGRRALTREQTLASIQREVSRLLNTRVPLSADALLHRSRTVIDYGIPEIGAFIPHDDRNALLLETLLADTISAFEPRLAEVRVHLERIQEPRRRVILVVEAVLACDSLRTPVTFPIAVDRHEPEGEAELTTGGANVS